jgi:hypothetical protein
MEDLLVCVRKRVVHMADEAEESVRRRRSDCWAGLKVLGGAEAPQIDVPCGPL